MRAIAFLLAVALMPPAAVWAQSADDLAKKLGSSNYVERERAAKMLEQLGKAALPALRNAITNADLETQRRAYFVIEKIEDRVLIEDLHNATPIRLEFKDMAVADVLREVEGRMALRLGTTTSKHRINKLDTGLVPYWHAWQQVRDASLLEESDYGASAAKLRPMVSSFQQDSIPIVSGRGVDKGPPFVAPRIEFAEGIGPAWSEDVRGSVRVRVRWLKTDYSLGGKKQHAIFAVEVRPEPRLEIATTPRVEITKIVDVDGKEIEARPASVIVGNPPPDVKRYLLAYVGEVQFGGLLHLKAIPWTRPDRAIKEMHGNVRLEATVRASLVEVPSVLKAVGKEVRGFHAITIKVLETDTSEEGDLVLRLRLSNLQALTPQTIDEQVVRVRPGFVAVRGAIDVAMERLRLVDAKGAAYQQVKATYQEAKDAKGYDVELHYAAKGDGKDEPTLMLTKAARTVLLDAPYVVRDLALAGKQ